MPAVQEEIGHRMYREEDPGLPQGEEEEALEALEALEDANPDKLSGVLTNVNFNRTIGKNKNALSDEKLVEFVTFNFPASYCYYYSSLD